MSARLLDGQAVAAAIRESVLPDVHAFTARPDGRPVSASSSSATTRRRRSTSATRCARAPSPGSGSTCSGCRRPRRSPICWRSSSELNDSERHDGILVQSPLPSAMGKGRAAAGVRRDRSGQGRRRLSSGQRRPARAGPRPPAAVHAVGRDRDARAQRRSRLPGARAVVDRAAARSSASRWRCCCCSATRRSRSATRRRRTCRPSRATADILVAAIGRPGFVTPDFVKPGATVIDVGHHPGDRRGDGAEAVRAGLASGSRTSPGADRSSSATCTRLSPTVAGALTPVPGGVGPLTIAMLLKNTVTAARSRRGTP